MKSMLTICACLLLLTGCASYRGPDGERHIRWPDQHMSTYVWSESDWVYNSGYQDTQFHAHELTLCYFHANAAGIDKTFGTMGYWTARNKVFWMTLWNYGPFGYRSAYQFLKQKGHEE